MNSTGANNGFIERLKYTFGQVNYKQAVLSLEDDTDQNDADDTFGPEFEIPEDIVKKAKPNRSYRLEMVGFE